MKKLTLTIIFFIVNILANAAVIGSNLTNVSNKNVLCKSEAGLYSSCLLGSIIYG